MICRFRKRGTAVELKESRRATGIQPSPTLTVSAKAARLRREGRDIIALSAGEPDFDTPERIKEAAARAMREGLTKYTPVDGLPELKRAITDKLRRENDLAYEDNQILVSCGCKHSIYNLAQALLDPGDEVIIPAPYWVSYPDITLLAGGHPALLYASNSQNFKLLPEQLAQAITGRTRLLLLNSPNNPSGASYDEGELQRLAEVLLQHPQVLIASDDIYEHIRWQDEPFRNILNVCPELAPRTVICNGVSKAYAMTGWRIGYAAGPEWIVAAMKKIQSQSTSGATSIAQAAACEALAGDQSEVKRFRDAFRERHDYVCRRLDAMPHIHCLPAAGTFYLFPDFGPAIQRQGARDDVAFAEYLLEEAGLAMVPGTAFGAPGHMRLSFAAGLEVLTDAMDRLELALKGL